MELYWSFMNITCWWQTSASSKRLVPSSPAPTFPRVNTSFRWTIKSLVNHVHAMCHIRDATRGKYNLLCLWFVWKEAMLAAIILMIYETLGFQQLFQLLCTFVFLHWVIASPVFVFPLLCRHSQYMIYYFLSGIWLWFHKVFMQLWNGNDKYTSEARNLFDGNIQFE